MLGLTGGGRGHRGHGWRRARRSPSAAASAGLRAPGRRPTSAGRRPARRAGRAAPRAWSRSTPPRTGRARRRSAGPRRGRSPRWARARSGSCDREVRDAPRRGCASRRLLRTAASVLENGGRFFKGERCYGRVWKSQSGLDSERSARCSGLASRENASILTVEFSTTVSVGTLRTTASQGSSIIVLFSSCSSAPSCLTPSHSPD